MSRFVCSYDGHYDRETVNTLCDGLHIQPLTARALIRLGLTRTEDAARFLSPEALLLYDPFGMPGIRAAVERLRCAFLADEPICVYGDYDADGICATAILLDCFSEYTTLAFPYIPSRHEEGYGLNEAAVRSLRARGVKLIVTVDNGVSAAAEVALCDALGIDVIVTDHHKKPDKLPDCIAVLTPDDAACGAGVALRLARALAGDARLDRWLPMAALATVADVVPLVDDNRIVVARGLPLIEENTGLRALLRAAGNGENAVDASTLAFLLAPRLNAAGRLGDALRGVSLLLAEDPLSADQLASALNEANAQRRSIETEILMQAEAMLETSPQPRGPAVLLYHADWNVGVIGIVASRLSEKLHCPVILFSLGAEELLTGSGRSAGNIDLYAALSACARHLTRFGGHAGAAGVSMRLEYFEAFCRDFSDYLSTHYNDEAFEPLQRYDETVALGELTLAAVSEIGRLAPFGEGNREPLYRLCGVRLTELRRMGQDGRHISARACAGSASLRAVGFGFGERYEELAAAESLMLFARPGLHAYRGATSVELMLRDAQNEEKLFNDFFLNVLYNNVCVELFAFLRPCLNGRDAFSDDAMRRTYLKLQGDIGPAGCPVGTIASKYGRNELCSLIIFLELGFFMRQGDKLLEAPMAARRALTDSRYYRLLISNDEWEDHSWT